MTLVTTFQLVQNVDRRDERTDTSLAPTHILLISVLRKLFISSPFIHYYSVTGFLCAQHGAMAFQNCSLLCRHILSSGRDSTEYLIIILGDSSVI